MRKFIQRVFHFFLVAGIAMSLLLISYVCFDPFVVLKKMHYHSIPIGNPNRDYLSTELFLKNYKTYHYNSFIFGSSRTLAYRIDSWEKYLPKEAKPFKFDAYGETIYGIYTKMKFLDKLEVKMDNALLIFCRNITFQRPHNSDNHLTIKHPATSGESEWMFHWVFFKAYLNPNYFFEYLWHKMTGKQKVIDAEMLHLNKMTFDSIRNEMDLKAKENSINLGMNVYYMEKKNLFYKRKGELLDPKSKIKKTQLFMLKEIKRLLEKHNTNYKIVISPLYEQMKFSVEDRRILKQLFGDHIYDFSGKNYFTDDVTHYYEASHYRPMVGDSILSIIYADKK
jgi:hypothetical protein